MTALRAVFRSPRMCRIWTVFVVYFRYRMSDKTTLRRVLEMVWLAVIVTAVYLYFFQNDFVTREFLLLAATPLWLRAVVVLALGCLRGFTLIPVTYLIILGILLVPPTPLYAVILVGVLISSVSIYYFSEFLHMSEVFERKYPKQIAQIKTVMEKNELPIVIGWSFFPFAPTDVICYVCGTLEIDIKKFIAGVMIGEGIACALYIFLGKEILSFLIHRF